MESTVVEAKTQETDKKINDICSMPWLKHNSQLPAEFKGMDVKEIVPKTQNMEDYVPGTKPAKKKRNKRSKSKSASSFDTPKDPNSKNSDTETEYSRNQGRNPKFLPVTSITVTSSTTVWNAKTNAATALFPEAQSQPIQIIDEDVLLSAALEESILTARLERFRTSDENKVNWADDSEELGWDSAINSQLEISDGKDKDTEKIGNISQDDNNNSDDKSHNSKEQDSKQVDKYRRVGSCRERNLVTGSGARMKDEQMFGHDSRGSFNGRPSNCMPDKSEPDYFLKTDAYDNRNRGQRDHFDNKSNFDNRSSDDKREFRNRNFQTNQRGRFENHQQRFNHQNHFQRHDNQTQRYDNHQRHENQPQRQDNPPQRYDNHPQRHDNQPQRHDGHPQTYDNQPPIHDNHLQRYDNHPQRHDNQHKHNNHPQRYDNQPQRQEIQPQRQDNQPQRYDHHPQRHDNQFQRHDNYPQRYDNQPQRHDNNQSQRHDNQHQRYDNHHQRNDYKHQPYNQHHRYDNQFQRYDNQRRFDNNRFGNNQRRDFPNRDQNQDSTFHMEEFRDRDSNKFQGNKEHSAEEPKKDILETQQVPEKKKEQPPEKEDEVKIPETKPVTPELKPDQENIKDAAPIAEDPSSLCFMQESFKDESCEKDDDPGSECSDHSYQENISTNPFIVKVPLHVHPMMCQTPESLPIPNLFPQPAHKVPAMTYITNPFIAPVPNPNLLHQHTHEVPPESCTLPIQNLDMRFFHQPLVHNPYMPITLPMGMPSCGHVQMPIGNLPGMNYLQNPNCQQCPQHICQAQRMPVQNLNCQTYPQFTNLVTPMGSLLMPITQEIHGKNSHQEKNSLKTTPATVIEKSANNLVNLCENFPSRRGSYPRNCPPGFESNLSTATANQKKIICDKWDTLPSFRNNPKDCAQEKSNKSSKKTEEFTDEKLAVIFNDIYNVPAPRPGFRIGVGRGKRVGRTD